MSWGSGIRQVETEGRYGDCSGYVLEASRGQLVRYLAQFSLRAAAIAYLVRERCAQVSILSGLYVSEESRGQGHGAALLRQFLGEMAEEGCDAVLLVADASQAQRPGFSLQSFYQGFGFVPVCETAAGPLMVYPEDVGLALQEGLATRGVSPCGEAEPKGEAVAGNVY